MYIYIYTKLLALRTCYVSRRKFREQVLHACIPTTRLHNNYMRNNCITTTMHVVVTHNNYNVHRC